jgi:hypothetical protein
MRALALAPGPAVGRLLDELLERVIADPMLNERTRLLAVAREVVGAAGSAAVDASAVGDMAAGSATGDTAAGSATGDMAAGGARLGAPEAAAGDGSSPAIAGPAAGAAPTGPEPGP